MSADTPNPLFVRAAVKILYESRKNRITHPDGRTDNGGRWYPTSHEDCGSNCGSVRSPSRAWPWSYMVHCRTLKHCKVLIARYLAGEPVPADVSAAFASVGLRDVVAAEFGQ